MMMRKNNWSKVFLATCFILVSSCSSDSSSDNSNNNTNDDDGGSTAQPIPNPSSATLLFPEDNTECNTGEIINDDESAVTFEWTIAENTDSYEIQLTDLESNETINRIVNTNSATIEINRGAPYEWQVISRATGTNATASSATFRFYNEGPGVENYAPFPAVALNPKRGSFVNTASPVLEWSTSDIDGDAISYEIYFGTDPAQLSVVETTTESSYQLSDLVDGTNYFWRVNATDTSGNTSISEVFEFRLSL